MLPMSTIGGGQCMGMPDICLTPAPPAPPIPVPYPNIAMTMQALPPTCSMKVMVEMKFAVVMNSMIPMSSGDEAGVAGGVMSGMIKGPATYTKGSMKVMAEGKPVCYLTSMVRQNQTNVPAGLQIVPSQVKVLIPM